MRMRHGWQGQGRGGRGRRLGGRRACQLRCLECGERAVIDRLGATGELARRLRDMGLVPGTEVEVMGRAPLRDPVQIRVRGTSLALRNNEADQIYVTRDEADE